MPVQLSVATRNASLDAIEAAIGAAPTLEIRTGAPPANCAAADTGTVLASLVLPSDWAAAAINGAKSLLGTWQDLAADAAGTAGHFRLRQAGTVHMQGNVTVTGAGGDMQLQTLSIGAGQRVVITAFTLTAGGGGGAEVAPNVVLLAPGTISAPATYTRTQPSGAVATGDNA